MWLFAGIGCLSLIQRDLTALYARLARLQLWQMSMMTAPLVKCAYCQVWLPEFRGFWAHRSHDHVASSSSIVSGGTYGLDKCRTCVRPAHEPLSAAAARTPDTGKMEIRLENDRIRGQNHRLEKEIEALRRALAALVDASDSQPERVTLSLADMA